MAANTMLKRVAARTQPCFISFVTKIHLFRMAVLSVISGVPSTLSNGEVLDDCGP